jgi:CheY-like chemotaxis protein/ligand-binding sensor protein
MQATKEQAKNNILLVEDEVLLAMAESRLIASAGHDVTVARNGEDAVPLARETGFDLVLMDIDLGPGIDGGEAARRIREAGGPPVVFLSSHSEETAIAKTRGSGAYGFILKGSADRVLLASVRMALELSAALRNLEESESRWASLARNAADYIVSIGPDGRILFSNRLLGGEGGLGPGAQFSSFALPEYREAVERSIDRAFSERVFTRQLLRSAGPGGGSTAYEALFGPAGTPGRPEYLTAVLREVEDSGLSAAVARTGSPENRAVLEAAISSFDFAPLRELIDGFHALTGMQISIVRSEDRFIIATDFSRACAAFHRSSPAALALCDAAGRAAQVAVPEPGGPGYIEYRCPHGLVDIAVPLFVEGMRWGTIFVGQFLYDDDDPGAGVAKRASDYGWDADDYLSAMKEVPRISRARLQGILAFFKSIAGLAVELASSAYRERLLMRRLREAGIDPRREPGDGPKPDSI